MATVLKRLRSVSRAATTHGLGRGRGRGRGSEMLVPDSELELQLHDQNQLADYSVIDSASRSASRSKSRSRSLSRSRSRSRTGGYHTRSRSRSLSASGLPVIASVAATEIEAAKRANKRLVKTAADVTAALRTLASKTRAFAAALHAFADAAPALSDTPAHHVRQFAHLQSIAAHGYDASAQHFSTDFLPSLRTNAACHKQTLKANHGRFKVAQSQHNRHIKQLERSGAHLSDHIHPNRRHSADPRIATAQVSQYQSGIRDLSRLAMDLEHIKNAHFDAVMAEEHRNAQFVAAACSTAMARQSADLWVRTYAHVANSTPLTNGDGTLARPTHPPPPAPMPLASGGVMSTYYEAPPEKQHGLHRGDSGTYLLNRVDEDNDLFQSAIYGQNNSRTRRAQSPRAHASGAPPRPPRPLSSPNHGQVHRSHSLSSAPPGIGGHSATGYGSGSTRSSPPFVAPPPPAGSPPNHHHQQAHQQQHQQRHYSPAGRSATLAGYPKSSSHNARAPPAVSWSPAAAAAARAAASSSPSTSAAGTFMVLVAIAF
ncbi:hypothetical protein BCR44DRAFT_31325, partial [Catenaria anguillulae PL171]